jgi:hypothetical protein
MGGAPLSPVSPKGCGALCGEGLPRFRAYFQVFFVERFELAVYLSLSLAAIQQGVALLMMMCLWFVELVRQLT